MRFTEDDAGYVTVRPVVKQTFRLPELADMIVSVTGKNAVRVQQIFRAGTVVYNGYRYWWDGFAAKEDEITGLLALFPDDDPARLFNPAKVTAVSLKAAQDSTPRYEKYSYAERADVYRIHLSFEMAASLLKQVLAASPRGLRKKLAALHPPAAILFFIPRTNSAGKGTPP